MPRYSLGTSAETTGVCGDGRCGCESPAPHGSSLPVAGPRLGIALGAEGGPSTGIGVGGPAGRRGHGAAGRRGEAGALVGAGRCLGARGTAVRGRLRGLRGVGLRGEAAPRVLLRLLSWQLLRLPGKGGGWGWGCLLAVGPRELLRWLRRGLLLTVAGWKGKEHSGEAQQGTAGVCSHTYIFL